MMKRLIVLLGLLVVMGCTYEQEYREGSFLRDPHFTAYKNNRDALESSYLKKEITYAEYIEQRDHLDDQYAKEVQKRTAVIIPEE